MYAGVVWPLSQHERIAFSLSLSTPPMVHVHMRTHTRTHTQDLSTFSHCDYHGVKSMGVMQIVFHSRGLGFQGCPQCVCVDTFYPVVGHSSCVWAHCLTTDVSELCYILKILHVLSSQNKKRGTRNFKRKSRSKVRSQPTTGCLCGFRQLTCSFEPPTIASYIKIEIISTPSP